MFTGVFKDRTSARTSATGVRETLSRLLQSHSLQPHRFIRHACIGPFVVEHVCRERAVIVELQRSGTIEADRLRARLQFFTTLGFKVVLLKPTDVLKRPGSVLEQIQAALQ
ncbi:MAG TPA: DUF559 domain-containing protein [Steroidobacteraceae bacterium]|nr:DUF559 domain-containing protein [Steroidobacteraceae bacterium]